MLFVFIVWEFSVNVFDMSVWLWESFLCDEKIALENRKILAKWVFLAREFEKCDWFWRENFIQMIEVHAEVRWKNTKWRWKCVGVKQFEFSQSHFQPVCNCEFVKRVKKWWECQRHWFCEEKESWMSVVGSQENLTNSQLQKII